MVILHLFLVVILGSCIQFVHSSLYLLDIHGRVLCDDCSSGSTFGIPGVRVDIYCYRRLYTSTYTDTAGGFHGGVYIDRDAEAPKCKATIAKHTLPASCNKVSYRPKVGKHHPGSGLIRAHFLKPFIIKPAGCFTGHGHHGHHKAIHVPHHLPSHAHKKKHHHGHHHHNKSHKSPPPPYVYHSPAPSPFAFPAYEEYGSPAYAEYEVPSSSPRPSHEDQLLR